MASFFFQTKEEKKTQGKKKSHKEEKKCKEGEELTFKLPFCPFHFWLLLLSSCFCTFVSSVFS
jgi:hypothetical protein